MTPSWWFCHSFHICYAQSQTCWSFAERSSAPLAGIPMTAVPDDFAACSPCYCSGRTTRTDYCVRLSRSCPTWGFSIHSGAASTPAWRIPQLSQSFQVFFQALASAYACCILIGLANEEHKGSAHSRTAASPGTTLLIYLTWSPKAQPAVASSNACSTCSRPKTALGLPACISPSHEPSGLAAHRFSQQIATLLSMSCL